MSDNTTLEIGALINDRYEVLGVLGQGGFGVVYRARQHTTQQDVAVKVLHPMRLADAAQRQREVQRFLREMSLIPTLKHPNIVRLIDSGQLDDGQLFTVLEFIDGLSLSELIEAHGALPLRDAVRLMTQVLEALHCAHTQGVVHRDLKPANIMVTDVGGLRNAMVLDFGIASVTEDARDEDFKSLTGTGQIHGTPAYMAPEQLEGELTPQSDLYAWGLVLLELLTGQRAVQAESLAKIIFQHISPDPVPIPDNLVGTPLGEVLQSATAKPLEVRAKSAHELLDLLQTFDPRTLDHISHGNLTQSLAHGSADTAALPLRGPSADTAAVTAPVDRKKPPHVWRRPVLVLALALIVIGSIVVATLVVRDQRAKQQPNEPCLVPGQMATRDTLNNCCWPRQSWNAQSQRCVGTPSVCPLGYYAADHPESQDGCALLPCFGSPGRVRIATADGPQCCWPEQGWLSDDARCHGTANCSQTPSALRDAGFRLIEHHGDSCLIVDEQLHLTDQTCRTGNTDACITVAAFLLDSPRGAPYGDSPEAMHYIERAGELLVEACSDTKPHACNWLGRVHQRLDRIKPDALTTYCEGPRPPVEAIRDRFCTTADHDEAAAALFKRACDGGWGVGCYDLAQVEATLGQPLSVDLLQRGCEGGFGLACDQLGLHNIVTRDATKIVPPFQRACALNNPHGCLHLGERLLAAPQLSEAQRTELSTFVSTCRDDLLRPKVYDDRFKSCRRIGQFAVRFKRTLDAPPSPQPPETPDAPAVPSTP